MNCLTAQERKVLVIVMMLLAVGGLAKVWRAAHPPAAVTQKTPPEHARNQF